MHGFHLNNEPIDFLDLRPELEKHRIFPIANAAMGKFGQIICQQMIGEGYAVNYTIYQIITDTVFHVNMENATVAFHIAYKNKLESHCKGFERIIQKERQFNISYVPHMDSHLYFSAGCYATFSVHFSTSYLYRFIPYLLQLENFLQNMQKGDACRLTAFHPYANAQMMEVIANVLQHNYKTTLDNIYLECKVLELLTLSIECISEDKRKQFTLNDNDIKLIEDVKEWLNYNMDHPGTLADISRKFAMNEFKLKKGFKQLLGVSVFDYLVKLKMDKAQCLLRETNKPIADIAYEMGYSQASHFTNAYKNFYGYPPIVERKR